MCGRSKKILVIVSVAFLLFLSGLAEGARIKDIAFVEGVRSNHLVGYGIVVGLNGTGDKTGAVYTNQSIANMLNKMGMKLDPKKLRIKNTAAVVVTAELPPFAKSGTKIDVLVSSLGDAKSLQGGTLVATPLRGADGRIYAVAQGAVSLGGFSAGGGGGTSVTKNHQTTARISGGATVEKELTFRLNGLREVVFTLRDPDFTTAMRMATAINEKLGQNVATAVDGGRIRVEMPSGFRGDMVDFIASIEGLDVKADSVSKVVVNERTGTVVMGKNVTISAVAVSHGDITIEIKTQYLISQPGAFSEGETVVQPVEEVDVTEKKARLVYLPESVTLGDVVKALNLVGVTPRDLVAILQAIKAAGALQAELEII